MAAEESSEPGDDVPQLRAQIAALPRDNERLRATEAIARKAQADLLALIENTDDYRLEELAETVSRVVRGLAAAT